MASIAIQSDKKEKYCKLSYIVRSLYQIICNTSHGSYVMRKLHKSNSPELKFMVYDLYYLAKLMSILLIHIHGI